MTVRASACVAALSLLAGACAVTGERLLSVEALYSGGQCGGLGGGATVTLIDRQAGMDDLGSRIAAIEMAPHGMPAFDFDARMVVLIEMGEKPTGGYGLRLADTSARFRDGGLELRVEWIEPQPDMLLTQAITSPCLLLEVGAADYRRILVRDQNGKVRSVWSRE